MAYELSDEKIISTGGSSGMDNLLYLIVVLGILGGGNGGFFGGNGTAKTDVLVTEGFQNTNNLLYSQNMMLSEKICDTNSRIDLGNATINQNISNLKYEIAEKINTGNQAILDAIKQNEIDALKTRICAAEQLISEQRIISQMKPQAPIPAYVVDSPYAPRNGWTC